MSTEWKIEVVFVPVTDVDRAKEFYERVGFHADHDSSPEDGLRFVQMTPPGSACSIAFGTGLGIDLAPGALNNVMLVVPDADEALAHLRALSIPAEGVDEQDWGRFVQFSDPDGNTWTLQQLPNYG